MTAKAPSFPPEVYMHLSQSYCVHRSPFSCPYQTFYFLSFSICCKHMIMGMLILASVFIAMSLRVWSMHTILRPAPIPDSGLQVFRFPLTDMVVCVPYFARFPTSCASDPTIPPRSHQVLVRMTHDPFLQQVQGFLISMVAYPIALVIMVRLCVIRSSFPSSLTFARV